MIFNECVTIILVFLYLLFLLFNNKMVVGSGSKGTPKYMGESVTCGVFCSILKLFSHVHMYPHSQCCDTTSCNDITKQILMMSMS